MKFSSSGIWPLVILVLCCEIQKCFSSSATQNVITWHDLFVTRTGQFQLGNVDEARVIVVDPLGGGDAKTVNAAIKMVPENNNQRVKIHILPGVYKEKVFIPPSKPYISLIGDPLNRSSTVITGNVKASDPDGNGGEIGTLGSATVDVQADYFCASGITFQNTVVTPPDGREGYQAVALKASGDKSVFYNVQFIGSQDTLLDWIGSHYFYKCFIQGATDFISGNARSLYQECIISVVRPGYAIAAQKREMPDEDTGFSFVNCTVTGDGTIPYLGRAWGQYSRIIYSLSKLDIDVMSGGWHDWGNTSRQRTAIFGEYQNSGRGAMVKTGKAASWSRALSYVDVRPFLDITFVGGEKWLKLDLQGQEDNTYFPFSTN